MKKSHNKKRNVGIIYELLLGYIAEKLINEDKASAQKALDIIDCRFNNDKELYREFRLFNALVKTTVKDTSVAAAILTEAKNAARRCNIKKLNNEKSLLIKDINYILNDKNFYYRRVSEYKKYATIQTLLNDWRLCDSADLNRVIIYESRVIESLISEKEKPSLSKIENDAQNVDALVVKIMTEKINDKYNDKLSTMQKKIIKEYAIYGGKNNSKILSEKIENIKIESKNNLARLARSTKNQTILEKIEVVIKKINQLSSDKIDDQSISRLLLISELNDKIGEEINESK